MDHVSESARIDKQRRRRRSRRREADRRRGVASHWVRAFYFGLAALWGYALGAAALVLALRSSGHTLDVNLSILTLVGPGALVALLGAMIAAAAYREARRRLS